MVGGQWGVGFGGVLTGWGRQMGGRSTDGGGGRERGDVAQLRCEQPHLATRGPHTGRCH